MDVQKQFYSITELATILGFSRSGIYGLIKKGAIPYTRLGDRVLIPRSFVDDMLNSVNK